MILALHAAGPITQIWLFETTKPQAPTKEWESGRSLAAELLPTLDELTDMTKLTGIILFSGPGSFTSLRIGHTTANAVADTLSIPIVGATGDDWLATGLSRLQNRENDQIALPFYGAEANVTMPKMK